MSVVINKPPFDQPLVDKNGYISRPWQRYIDQEHRKTGGTSAVLPVANGGTGTNSVAGLAAAQGEASTTASPTALTQSKTAELNAPDAGIGQTANTTISWAAAFSDAIYDPTISLIGGRRGTLSYVSQTANDITVRLTNTDEFIAASGSATVTGVHA